MANKNIENALLTVAIPTLGREKILVDSISYILQQFPSASEILVLDQTPIHEPETTAALNKWNGDQINWIRLPQPSIPMAMNKALELAANQIVLFLDDDIVPAPGLVATHAASFKDPSIWAVVGQVLQPGQDVCNINYHSNKSGIRAYMDFPFNSSTSAFVQNIMAGNLSVLRKRALDIGGFDENFVGVAYRFETEFAKRITRHGGKILYEPKASIRHLRVEHGGTRSRGTHMTSASPRHGVGDYYFALRQGLKPETIAYIFRRPFREVRTKFHLRHPWWIPIKLVGEFCAFFHAILLLLRGPRYMHGAKNKWQGSSF